VVFCAIGKHFTPANVNWGIYVEGWMQERVMLWLLPPMVCSSKLMAETLEIEVGKETGYTLTREMPSEPEL